MTCIALNYLSTENGNFINIIFQQIKDNNLK